MTQNEFETLVKTLCLTKDLPQALEVLRACEDDTIAEQAQALTGQFSLAQVNGAQVIYHVFTEENDQGEPQEFVEKIMSLDDDIILFVAWFFSSQFEIKSSDVYSAAGRTYKQPKRN